MERRYRQIDVFGAHPQAGNPLAVVHDAEDLSTGQMQSLARWMNLSETVFLLPPTRAEADYLVRIFTTGSELPFAGHPTLGSAHAWLEAGGAPKRDGVVVQECGAGLVHIRADDERLAFEAPPPIRTGEVEPSLLERVGLILRIDPNAIIDAQWADNGPGWVAVQLRDADTVLSVEIDPGAFSDGGPNEIGIVGLYPDGSECAYEVRAIFREDDGRITEDPVTGSLHAALAQWLLPAGRVKPPYVASQGTKLGATGRVHIEQDDDGTIWVGGATTTIIRGTIET